MSNFIHLHNHTHYSLLDGASKVDDLIKSAKQFKMNAVSITDHGNMFGAVEFYQKALKEEIKPIIGMEAYIAKGSRLDKTSYKGISKSYYHFTLLAKNLAGYKNLIKLSTTGYLEGFYYRPRIDKEVLKEHSKGLVGLSGCLKGEIPQLILNNNYDEAKNVARFFQEVFSNDFYIEIMDHKIEEELVVKPILVKLARELNIPLIATNDDHYIKREHARAQEILLCISLGKDLSAPDRLRFPTDELYFKSAEEMEELFKDLPDALENTCKVADKCNLLLDLGKHYLPNFPLPEGETSLDGYLEKLANEGLKKRFSQITSSIQKRLDYELSIIKKMGFSGYFLIVNDLIDFAHRNGIAVGPGRGSAAGSLVSYTLGITNLDPLKFNLIFERFLNPERVSLPDIDIDFCYERRNEVINYAIKKYGKDNVSQIITFGSLSAKAVVRDVGRVMGLPYGEVDRIAKLIPNKIGITLDEAIEMEQELKNIAIGKGIYSELLKYARLLEGLVRHASTHAAGVVITPLPLTEYLPLYKHVQNSKSKNREGENTVSIGEITTQYTMKYVEAIGLLKMDFLGLRTLTVIDKVVKELNNKGIEIEIDNIPLNDKETYNLFSMGETIGIFQFESSGMRDYLKKLKPEYLEDLIAMNALYRPGPMEMIDEFIQCKRGTKKIEYFHPSFELILKETYGVIVYQEQVIRIASDLAGFSKAKGDQLRRAMGKKNVEIMEALRDEFLKGVKRKGIDEKTANDIFDLMNKFAGYGFNKSHSAGYALIAYQTAYLKSHYPAEFMACTISSEMDRTDRVATLIEECKRIGIEILPPDINESVYDFKVISEKIRFGLGAIKNVGRSAIESIVNAREMEGRFNTIFDVCKQVDLRLVNRKVLESLVLVGAMDSLEGTRAQKFNSIDQAISFGQKYQEEKEKKQTNIFEFIDSKKDIICQQPSLTKITEDWTKFHILSKEKELLGFYISGHPLLKYENKIKKFVNFSINDIGGLKNGTPVKIGGIIAQHKVISDKKNKTMAFVTIEDITGSVELVLFADVFKKYGKFLDKDNIILIQGKTSIKETNNVKIICDEVIPLEDVINNYKKYLLLKIETTEFERQILNDIEKELIKYEGEYPVYFEVVTSNGDKIILESQKYKISPDEKLVSNLKKILGNEKVIINV
jgi:DNA polymerase-3 subunit alpha